MAISSDPLAGRARHLQPTGELVAIRGNPWQSVAISGHHKSPAAQRVTRVIRRNQAQSDAIRRNQAARHLQPTGELAPQPEDRQRAIVCVRRGTHLSGLGNGRRLEGRVMDGAHDITVLRVLRNEPDGGGNQS